jgi:hypothetical protein
VDNQNQYYFSARRDHAKLIKESDLSSVKMDGARRRVESFHEDFDSKNEEAQDTTMQNDPPTRSRSRSVHQNDEIAPPRPVTLVDPLVLPKEPQQQQQQDSRGEKPSSERSGPLKVREVLALKMVSGTSARNFRPQTI